MAIVFSRVIAAFLLSCVGIVYGHGGGLEYYINGVLHPSNWKNFENIEGSIQRLWRWDYQIQTLDDPRMICGDPGTVHPKAYHGKINAGDAVKINMSFVHDHGPILAYMAACPDEGCQSVNLEAPIWFKVFEEGLLSGTWTEGHWAMRDLNPYGWWNIPIPASLKPGKYILRHEMINLETGPVQFFANCIHLDVNGPGTNLPEDDQLVAFPSVYEKDLDISFAIDQGTNWFYNIHAHDTTYPMPGPPLWQG